MSRYQLADEHNLPDFSMETFNDLVTQQHVTAETCSSSRLSYVRGVLSVSLNRLIRLSLYESSIRSSVPSSYGSLACYLSHSTKERLCVKSPVLFTPYPKVFIMPMSLWGAGGWLVVCSRTAVEYAVFLGVSEWECVRGRGGCSTAYSTSYHMGRLQSRKGGWQAAILSLHQDFIADGMLRMLSYLDAEQLNST